MSFLDASIFFNEVELFELRLHALQDVVEAFYVVEGTRTFTGMPRDPVFPKHEQRFRAICGRLKYALIDLPEHGHAWEREALLRNALACATERGKWALISDADEIADPETLDFVAAQVGSDGFACLHHRWAPYALNGHREGYSLGGTLVHPHPGVRRSPERMRNERNLVPGAACGWHWTSLGGPGRILEKLHAYSEDAPSRPDIPYLARPEIANEAWITEALGNGMDFFYPERRDVVVEYLDMKDPRIPKAARTVAKSYPHLVHKESSCAST